MLVEVAVQAQAGAGRVVEEEQKQEEAHEGVPCAAAGVWPGRRACGGPAWLSGLWAL